MQEGACPVLGAVGSVGLLPLQTALSKLLAQRQRMLDKSPSPWAFPRLGEPACCLASPMGWRREPGSHQGHLGSNSWWLLPSAGCLRCSEVKPPSLPRHRVV